MAKRNINDLYFDWLYDMVCKKGSIKFRKLFDHLHRTEFTYLLDMDENRYQDGKDLRYRFAFRNGYDYNTIMDYIPGPCSVLEMIVALAIDCEEQIMADPEYGDRTNQWFWQMLTNLGLSYMNDARYNREEVDYILDRFLNREYDFTGEGGLFTIPDTNTDLRKVEIWYQLCWYVNSKYL